MIRVEHEAPPGMRDYFTRGCALDGKPPAFTTRYDTQSPLRLAKSFMTDRRELISIFSGVAGGLGTARSCHAGPAVVKDASRRRLQIRTKLTHVESVAGSARQRRPRVTREAALNEVTAVGILAAPSGGSTPASWPARRPLWAGQRNVSPLSSIWAPLTTLPSTQRRLQCRAPKRASLRRACIATVAGRRDMALLALDGLRIDALVTG